MKKDDLTLQIITLRPMQLAQIVIRNFFSDKCMLRVNGVFN